MRPSRWSPARALALLLMVAVWAGSGVGVYLFLSTHRGTLANQAKQPIQQAKNGPLRRLPGTLYLVQDGTLYRLKTGTFTPLLRRAGQAAWSQPAIGADG